MAIHNPYQPTSPYCGPRVQLMCDGLFSPLSSSFFIYFIFEVVSVMFKSYMHSSTTSSGTDSLLWITTVSSTWSPVSASHSKCGQKACQERDRETERETERGPETRPETQTEEQQQQSFRFLLSKALMRLCIVEARPLPATAPSCTFTDNKTFIF